MIKRRATLENSEKAKRNRITEYLLELDKCIQLPNDHRLLIRKKIKDSDEEVINLFQTHRKDKNYHQLQIKLRKIIQLEKNLQKRYTMNNGDRKKSQFSQRVYSQNSQNGSFKNSIKASPEKQQSKRALITFDICQLKKKIEECHNDSKSSFRLETSLENFPIRINSISRIDTSVNKSRETSLDKLALRQQKPFHPINPNKIHNLNMNKQLSSKITLRINEGKNIGKENVNEKILIDQKFKEQKTMANYSNISYSSSIKNLLMDKLKDQREVKKQKIILKDHRKNEEIIASNRSYAEQTAIKKSVKPMQRDEIHPSPKTYNEHFPMYIQTTQNSEDERKTEKKLEDIGYMNRKGCMSKRGEKLETLVNLQSQEQKYGQFYMKIKDIINNKNY